MARSGGGAASGVIWCEVERDCTEPLKGLLVWQALLDGNATGPNAGKLLYSSALADSRSYSVCNAQSPFLHFATMTGLVAGQQYYYSIDGGKECGVTPPKLFTAPKVVGAPAAQTYPFTMLAYADMGISNSEYTAAFIAQKVSARCLRFRDWAAWLAWRARRAKASPHPPLPAQRTPFLLQVASESVDVIVHAGDISCSSAGADRGGSAGLGGAPHPHLPTSTPSPTPPVRRR